MYSYRNPLLEPHLEDDFADQLLDSEAFESDDEDCLSVISVHADGRRRQSVAYDEFDL